MYDGGPFTSSAPAREEYGESGNGYALSESGEFAELCWYAIGLFVSADVLLLRHPCKLLLKH